jgi:hypothetical protein
MDLSLINFRSKREKEIPGNKINMNKDVLVNIIEDRGVIFEDHNIEVQTINLLNVSHELTIASKARNTAMTTE